MKSDYPRRVSENENSASVLTSDIAGKSCNAAFKKNQAAGKIKQRAATHVVDHTIK